MIHIKSLPIAPIETNCYIVYDDEKGDAFVVDPGLDYDFILKEIGGLNVTHILLTHAHWDHIGGVKAVREATGAKVYVHSIEAEWLTNPLLNLSRGPAAGAIPEINVGPPDVTIEGGQQLTLLGEPIDVFHTPGHSPGHVAYLMGDVLFGGDVLFSGSVGRTDLPGGSHTQLNESIAAHFLTLPDDTTVLPGHGPATTIGHERRTNPFIV